MDIVISNLSKSYENRERIIFNNLSVRFKSGEISVIIGRSGVGKSSLLNLIAGIDLPDSGCVSIGSKTLSQMNDTQRTLFRRSNIGFVFQSFNLIPVLTVLENVSLVGRLDGMNEAECKERAVSVLSRVGLDDRLEAFPDRLSGGEQQRVALARALINDPDIILADEPTGNLDSKTGCQILETISEQVKTLGKTLVMVTHSREAMAYAHNIFRVKDYNLLPWESL